MLDMGAVAWGRDKLSAAPEPPRIYAPDLHSSARAMSVSTWAISVSDKERLINAAVEGAVPDLGVLWARS